MTVTGLRFLVPGALALGLTFFTACSKSTQTAGYVSQGTMTASVGGTRYAPSLTEAVYSPTTAIFTVIGIAPAKDTSFLQVILPASGYQIGTAFSSDSTESGLSWYDAQDTYVFDALFGNGASHSLITITSLDTTQHKVAGTFSGVLYNINNGSDSIAITNGTFSTTYTQE